MRLLIVWSLLTSVLCFNFDLENVDEIRFDSKGDQYFGYALLLQKGNQGSLPPRVIVGAPGQGAYKSGGSVYSCSTKAECIKYNIKLTNAYSPNGNFFGSVLDGGEVFGEFFITCAPRMVRPNNGLNYLNGWCFYKNTSFVVPETFKDIRPLQYEPLTSQYGTTKVYYYDYGFGQAGFDAHYIQDTHTILLGAPGVKNWNGAFIVLEPTQKQIIPKRSIPYKSDNYGYLGYKVTSGSFNTDPKDISYVAGSPRGSKLFGNVKIYKSSGNLVTTITGEEYGSYFGSSLLVADLDNDLRDDMVVGAPTAAGATWEEGYVYFYRGMDNKFASPVKLLGSQKTGARFGTSIALLGDIDLDSYNDIAISAPFEDDGVGAVYIYMGGATGVQSVYSQRLSPSKFATNPPNVKGFGQGLSKGVDIDGNGHNDVAIGAYKSNDVFVLHTRSVVDYKLTIQPNVSSVSSQGMNVTLCVSYTQRSAIKDLKTLPFKVVLQLDYRGEGQRDFTYSFNVTESVEWCNSLSFFVKNSPYDITPFKMSAELEILQRNVVGMGENKAEKSVPYSHGCGDDNICQTAILVDALSSLPHIVLGLNREVTIDVSADNKGEPGYSCDLYMNFSDSLELRNTRDCDLKNGTYICPFSTKLVDTVKEVPFDFDIKLIEPKLDKLKFSFELKCLGVNDPPDANKRELVLDVLVNNSPYIQGLSDPENFYFTDDNPDKDLEVYHRFRIANSGPSPIELDVYLVLPLVKTDDSNVFEVEAKGSLNGIEVLCTPVNRTFEKSYDLSSILTEPVNRTVVIDCYEDEVDCLVLFCNGEYLYRSTEIAEYNVRLRTTTKLLANRFRNELLNKDILAFVSSAYIFNATNRVESHVSTMIFTSKSKPVPLWAYIIAAILGVILLALLIFGLYKCHFFDRNYRDKLNDEKLMEQRVDDNMDNMEGVDLEQSPTSTS